MSLDVYLYDSPKTVECECPKCSNKHQRTDTEELYWANITGNLAEMADAAGIYQCLWKPEKAGIKTADQLIPLLTEGLTKMEEKPEYFKKFNASNGWGTYDQFIGWVKKYLTACKEYPEATVHSSY